MNNYLTITEAAKYAGVSKRTIYNWIDKKLLIPKYTPSGHMRFTPEDLVRNNYEATEANSN